MISNGSYIKFDCQYVNVRLQMGDYSLKTYMFIIELDGCGIILGVQWLQTLVLTTIHFCELCMSIQ